MTTSPLLDPLDHVFTDQQKHQDAHDSRGALPQRDTLSPAELLPGMTSCVKQKRKLFLGRLPAAVAWFGLLRPVIGGSHRGCRDRSGNKVPVPFRQTLKPISSLEHTHTHTSSLHATRGASISCLTSSASLCVERTTCTFLEGTLQTQANRTEELTRVLCFRSTPIFETRLHALKKREC